MIEMKTIRATMSALLVAAAVLPASAAQAQADMSAAQIESAVRFGLPSLFAGYRATCAAELSPQGYVTRNAARLEAKFADGSDAYWPAAREALMGMGGEQQEIDPAMLEQMPDDVLKPFVTTLIEQKVATEIKPAQCSDIERGLELLDPLPAENIAGLIGFVVEMAEQKDAGAAATGQ
jgi:hypothetical protein